MERAVLYQFLIGVPRAVVIWSALLVLALGMLTVLVARPGRATDDEPAEPVEDPAVTAAADLCRYVDEVAVAAAGAARTAQRRRDAWRAAHEELEHAWIGYDAAERAARRLDATVVLSVPDAMHTPAEHAARERWLHRTAMLAHWRGELTARQLSDVFARRAAWDPRWHPAEQEIFLARLVRDGRLTVYRAAGVREREAWRAAGLAAEAARTLAVEAAAAAEQLRAGEQPARRRVVLRRPAAILRWRTARVG
ncbi:hypothetical protein [Micromonospora endophytica]|uniref:Uncharacterized protein n=1 Tax=Micromonospora endophytica TaxID=515350 RepID=A0A2W2CDV3_9ACTN|nr:hypothetical protein [Micromonospora endophytica]PZF96702.1 hypothetical protein C1I93_13565 [Micromonospora endophytica]RIW42553.1 hypothetical protein D3H59_22865 [Micromonospora endophytica]BCJ57478.1 hypothetical protein Jiend_09000 [Micromonospora endophytica]